MDIFVTRIRLQNQVTKENIWELVCEWLKKSPHYNITSIDKYYFDEVFSQDFGCTRIDVLNYTLNNQNNFACRFKNNEENNTWITDIIFTDFGDKKEISIRLACENTVYSSDLPKQHKPHFIKLLFEHNYCYQDDVLPTIADPIFIKQDDLQLCAEIIRGERPTLLPVVYISYDSHNNKHYSVNPQVTAKSLSGIAHVLIEPDKDFSLALKNETSKKNAYNGYVGIYFPKTDYREIISLENYYKQGQIDAKALSYEIGQVVIQALINHSNTLDWTWERLQLEYHKVKFAEQQLILEEENKKFQDILSETKSDNQELISRIDSLTEQLKNKNNELNEFIDEFDKENEKLKEKIVALNSQLDNKSAQLESLKQKHNNDSLILSKNDLQDFFVDEIKDCIINILMQAKDKCIKNSRPYDILQNIVDSNPLSNHGKKIYQQIEEALNEKSLKARRSKLEQCGFSVSVGSHDKMYFHESKFSATLANSGSDCRGAENQYHDIKKSINVYIKLFP